MFCDEEVRLKLSFDNGNLFHPISYFKKNDSVLYHDKYLSI